MKARLNPFRAEITDALTFVFSEDSLPAVWERATVSQFRGQIVGPQGSGKTTLLTALYRESRKRGLAAEWLATVSAVRELLCRRAGLPAVAFVDCAGLLSFVDWLRLLQCSRRQCGVIATMHSRGFGLPLLYHCTTSARLMQQILRQIPDAPYVDTLQAAQLLELKRGNVRLALRELYSGMAGEAQHYGQTC